MALLVPIVLALVSGSKAPPLSFGGTQEEVRPPDAVQDGPRSRGTDASPAWPLPDHWLEASFNDDSSFNAAYRMSLGTGGGFAGGGLLLTEDDDWSFNLRLMRFGRPGGSRFTLGAGLGLYVISIDQPSEDAYALTFIGSAEYAFRTNFPTSVSLEAAFAPDATTFDGGESVLDTIGRVNIEVGSYARAFVGYRFFEVGIDGGGDADLAEAFHLGIGLAW